MSLRKQDAQTVIEEQAGQERLTAITCRDAARRAATREELSAALDRWIADGFGGRHSTDEETAAAGYPYIEVDLYDGFGKLRDFYDRVEFPDPPSDEALRQGALIALNRWGGRTELAGSWAPPNPTPNGDADRFWLACQRLGVTITNYLPSDEAKAKAASENDMKVGIRNDAETARVARAVLDGQIVEAPMPIRAFVASADADERQKIASLDGAAAAAFARKGERIGQRLIDRHPEIVAKLMNPDADPEPAAKGGK